jgi:hypothetical protein
LMIVPPAMPSSGRTEQLDEREKKFLRLLLEMANMRLFLTKESLVRFHCGVVRASLAHAHRDLHCRHGVRSPLS